MPYKKLKQLIPSELCLHYDTAWIGHGSFAMWATTTFKPQIIAELGSHGGYSYFAFCEAVKKYKINCKCYAIDTWKGDDHASFYSEAIYEAVKKINDANYSSFSTLIRKYFDQAVSSFQDKSIDILHIDGRHGYEDVKYDFECYEPKLSDNAVVLFHDTNCYKPGFGVYKFFQELTIKHPHAEFAHSSGLGIIFYGQNLTKADNQFNNIIKDLGNNKSTLYKALYWTGLLNMQKYRLARIIKKNHNKLNQVKFRIFKYNIKIYIIDFLNSLRISLKYFLNI